MMFTFKSTRFQRFIGTYVFSNASVETRQHARMILTVGDWRVTGTLESQKALGWIRRIPWAGRWPLRGTRSWTPRVGFSTVILRFVRNNGRIGAVDLTTECPYRTAAKLCKYIVMIRTFINSRRRDSVTAASGPTRVWKQKRVRSTHGEKHLNVIYFDFF